MLLPVVAADRDKKHSTDLILGALRTRYPNAKKWVLRHMNGELQAFVHGVREMTESDRGHIQAEMAKARGR